MRALAILAIGVLVAGCGGTSGSDRRPTVVAGFYPLAWAAQRIAGPGVRVVNLTPAGAEPHDLELTPGDIEAVNRARLVLYLGHAFQPAVEKAVDDRSGPSLDLLNRQRLASGAGDEQGALDPHVWLDPVRFARVARAIGAALHRERAAAVVAARLRRLDAQFQAGLRHCTRRELVTSHSAFGYLASRYGLRQVALAGLSPEAEPSPRDLEALVDEVRRSGATTVFTEPLVSSRLAATVAREAGVGVATLDPIEGLSDARLSAGEDYLSAMRSNLATLQKALGCR